MEKEVEKALRKEMKKKAEKECEHDIANYAECAFGKTFSVLLACRKQSSQKKQCLDKYYNDAVLEQMKKEFMLEQDTKGSPRI